MAKPLGMVIASGPYMTNAEGPRYEKKRVMPSNGVTLVRPFLTVKTVLNNQLLYYIESYSVRSCRNIQDSDLGTLLCTPRLRSSFKSPYENTHPDYFCL